MANSSYDDLSQEFQIKSCSNLKLAVTQSKGFVYSTDLTKDSNLLEESPWHSNHWLFYRSVTAENANTTQIKPKRVFFRREKNPKTRSGKS